MCIVYTIEVFEKISKLHITKQKYRITTYTMLNKSHSQNSKAFFFEKYLYSWHIVFTRCYYMYCMVLIKIFQDNDIKFVLRPVDK